MSATGHFPHEQNEAGEFERQEDAFRDWVSTDGSTPYPAEAGRYHLYVSLACPWASRTVITRHLRRLEGAVGMTVVDPIRDERGWAFRNGPGYDEDPIEGFKFLSEAYRLSDPNFGDRVTVPVLWDKVTRRIVNNSEDDICRMFNFAFASLSAPGEPLPDLFPKELEAEQNKLSEFIYENVNNGVYRAGFAASQDAYEHACRKLFESLDELESRLTTRRFLFGDKPVESDWRLFCTLIRFDAVYHGHFKCNLRRIIDYSNLDGYTVDLYQHPGIAATVNIDHIKRHYYYTHDDINPTRIVPIGPIQDFTRKHNRDWLT